MSIVDLNSMMLEVSRAVRRDCEAAGQLTLGQLLTALEKQRVNCPLMVESQGLKGFGVAHSYRGFYDHLAFEPSEQIGTVGEALEIIRKANYSSFEGYKGGSYLMTRHTPVWIANYGFCGRRIVGIGDSIDHCYIKTAEGD